MNYTLIVYQPSASKEDYDTHTVPSHQSIIYTDNQSTIVKQYAKYCYQNEFGYLAECELTLLIDGVLAEGSIEYKKIAQDAKEYLRSFESEEVKLRTLAWL